MKNCMDFMELISVYADNELTEADKQQVEDHIAACDSCSALLELYREISVAANESDRPVPEELCVNVMEKVLNDGNPGAAGNVTRLKRYRTVLTRYAPIAACLAVIMLALPFMTNRGMFDNSQFMNGAAIPAASPPVIYPAPAAPEAPGNAAAGAEDYTRRIQADDEVEVEASLSPEDAQEVYRIDENDTVPASSPPLTGNNNTQLAWNIDSDEPPPVEMPFDPGHTQAPAGAPPADPVEPVYPADPAEVPSNGESALDDTGHETDRFMTYFNHAFARVTVVGDFPGSLPEHESYGSWMGWDSVYVLPHTALTKLVEELSAHNKVEVVFHDGDSTYIVVMYSRNG